MVNYPMFQPSHDVFQKLNVTGSIKMSHLMTTHFPVEAWLVMGRWKKKTF